MQINIPNTWTLGIIKSQDAKPISEICWTDSIQAQDFSGAGRACQPSWVLSPLANITLSIQVILNLHKEMMMMKMIDNG